MYTKKTNNTNKLIQISYHSAITKIQKLQKYKIKKKLFFSFFLSIIANTPGTLEISQYAWYTIGMPSI